MKKQHLLALAMSFAVAHELSANGGTFSISAVQRAGDLVPEKKSAITLEREELHIRIEGDDAVVQVTYSLLNRGPADDVAFGFPVDIATSESLPAPNGYDRVLSNSFGDLKVLDNGKPVPVQGTRETPLPANERPRTVDEKLELVRRWSLMTLSFTAGERKQLVVSYRVRCVGTDYGFEGDWDWKFSKRTFFYTFRPAATWGDGRVGELTVKLDTSWLRERDIPIVNVSPGGEMDASGVMRWRLRNQPLDTLHDLVLEYDPAIFHRHNAIARQLIDPRALPHLEVSSSLHEEGRTYSHVAMLDRNLATSWVEGAAGNGIGESIVMIPKNVHLSAIGVLNGYWASAPLYRANGRIKRLRVELDVSGEHIAPDERHQVSEVTLPDRRYGDLNRRYPLTSADWVLNFPNGSGFVERVKLTILEAYPGSEFEDTAVTEFYVCGSAR